MRPDLRHRTGWISLLAILLFASSSSLTYAQGVSGPAFYVDGVVYRTVATPTNLSNTGAPAQSFDVIYEFFGVQPLNVATAAPGDRDYNGGRWQVHGLQFRTDGYRDALNDDQVDLNHNDVLDSDMEVLAAIRLGYAQDTGVIKSFECPVIRVPRNA
jgi:hypothetical protein